MEGYILYHRADAYAVLDGNQLMIYGRFNKKEQAPKDIQTVVILRNAQISKLVNRRGAKHGISILSESGVSTIFDCVDPNLCTTWYTVCTRAKTLHIEHSQSDETAKSSRTKLGFDEDTKLSKGMISRTYKRLSLKAHPDKGGSVEEFNALFSAYTALMAIQEVDDEREDTMAIEFEAIVEKQAGSGLGINVVEDKLRRQVVVQSTTPQILLRGLTAEAEGEIRPGDALIAIDADDCSTWPLSRIRARLSNLRAPVGAAVRFCFERRVPLDWTLPDGDTDEEIKDDASEPQQSPRSDAHPTETPTQNRSPGTPHSPPPPPTPASQRRQSSMTRLLSTLFKISPKRDSTGPSGQDPSNISSSPLPPQSPPHGTAEPYYPQSAPSPSSNTGPASPAPTADSRPSTEWIPGPSSSPSDNLGAIPSSPNAPLERSSSSQNPSPTTLRPSLSSQPLTHEEQSRLSSMTAEVLHLRAKLEAHSRKEGDLEKEVQELAAELQAILACPPSSHTGDGGSEWYQKRLLQSQTTLVATNVERRALAAHVTALRYSLHLAESQAIQRLHEGSAATLLAQCREDTYRTRELRAKHTLSALTALIGAAVK